MSVNKIITKIKAIITCGNCEAQHSVDSVGEGIYSEIQVVSCMCGKDITVELVSNVEVCDNVPIPRLPNSKTYILKLK